MAFDTKRVVLSLILIAHVAGSEKEQRESSSLLIEIENELKINFPSLQSLQSSGVFNMIHDLVSRGIPEELKHFVRVIDTGVIDDHYVTCVKQHRQYVKETISSLVSSNIDVHLLPLSDKIVLWEQVLDQIKTLFLFLTANDNDVQAEYLKCIQTYEDARKTFPHNYGDLLECFEEIVHGDTVADVISALWVIYERIDELVGELAELIADNLVGIDKSLEVLNEAVEDCMKTLKQDETVTKTSEVFTKESVGKLYQDVYTKLKYHVEYLEEMSLVGRTKSVGRVLVATSLSISNSVQTITYLRQEIIKLFNETELLGDDYEHCITENEETAVKILRTAFEDLESCSLILDEKRKIFTNVLSSIKTTINQILESTMSRLNDCVSEDYSSEGLSQSMACIDQLDVSAEEYHNNNFQLIWNMVKEISEEELAAFKEEVGSCAVLVAEDAEEVKRELVSTVEQCVKDIDVEATHDEL